MHFVLLAIIILGILIGPSLWVQSVLKRYSSPTDRYQGTGGELARVLLDRLGLEHVGVESTTTGDHYDPVAAKVRLTPDKLDGRSLTAITVAAHEVGHAMQDRDGFAPLRWRSRLVRVASIGEKVGAGLLIAAPLAGLLTRAPVTSLFFVAGGLMSLASVAAVHLVTLPTEFDASFTRALPILEGGGILLPGDAPHARKLLRAAALTYVSAAMMSLLNVGRWLAILRR